MTTKDRNYEILVNDNGKNGCIVKGWTKGVPICDRTIGQLAQMAKMPFIRPYIAVMPDAHWGMGSCVGSVIPTKDAIMPATVGVDIGCGMIAKRLSLKRSDFDGIEEDICSTLHRTIPCGRSDNGGDRDIGAWQGFPYNKGKIPEIVQYRWLVLEDEYNELIKLHGKGLKQGRTIEHLGTLGTGNHFIELAFDENQDVWIVIHSGSRGIGNKIGSYFIRIAQELCDRWLVQLPDRNLAFFPKGERRFDEYWQALQWAQRYAWNNRECMMELAFNCITNFFRGPEISITDEVHCHHNYAERENHHGQNVIITRKGAVRARKRDMGIIPGSMGERSFIVRGLENRDAFHSCSHGAGRIMSRAAARQSISLEDHKRDTEGVFCDKSSSVIDESPKSYKDIDKVMVAQSDLIEICHTLKGFINVKGVTEDRRKK